MELVSATFQSLAILCLMGAVGWWLSQRRILGLDTLRVLTTLSLDIALPCMVAATILTRFHPGEQPGWWHLPIGWLGFTLAAGVLVLLAGWAVGPAHRPEFRLCMLYQNAIFFPLAILTEMYGSDSEAVVDLFLFTLFFSAFFFNTHAFFFPTRERRIDWRKTIHPVTVVTLLCIVLTLTGVRRWVPTPFTAALKQIGDITVPLLMMVIGGKLKLDFQQAGPFYRREVVTFLAVKMLLFPALVLLLIWRLHPPHLLGLILLLQAAVPPIISAPAVIERLGGNSRLANQILVSSFGAAMVTVPLSVWLYIRIVGM